MAHEAQTDFVKSIREKHRDHFTGKRVLEVGSRNINGSVRNFFFECDYVGLDYHRGRGVDVTGLAHEYDTRDPFDVVISCEAFEHDP